MAQNQSGYSTAQIMEMQRDAMRRVNEMQRLAQQKVKQTGYIEQASTPSSKKEEIPDENEQHDTPIMQQQEQANELTKSHQQEELTEERDKGFKGILDRLNLDEEKITLLVLLVLLINEGADTKLILALGYILLQ